MEGDIYVVPAGEGWAVDEVGGFRRTIYATRDDAIADSTARAKKANVELVIFDSDGEVSERISFRPGTRH